MVTTKEVLSFFGDCSGMRTNHAKSSITPIACTTDEIETTRSIFPAQVAEFPIQYLGPPLTVGRLWKAHLQPLVDKVAACLPAWKASLMNKAGRLTTVKLV